MVDQETLALIEQGRSLAEEARIPWQGTPSEVVYLDVLRELDLIEGALRVSVSKARGVLRPLATRTNHELDDAPGIDGMLGEICFKIIRRIVELADYRPL